MSKKSEIGNEVANSMNDLLGNESFTRIFHNVKTASVKESVVDTKAVSDFNAFNKFLTMSQKVVDRGISKELTDHPLFHQEKTKELASYYKSIINRLQHDKSYMFKNASAGNYILGVLDVILNNYHLDKLAVDLAIKDIDNFQKIVPDEEIYPNFCEDLERFIHVAYSNNSLNKSAKKKDEPDKEDKDSDKDDKKKDKKDDKDSDKDDKKDKKKGKKKPFPFWLKKKKASDKCNCSADCSCKTGKCECEGCKDCAACGDKMYASAIKYMVETLTRTSAALDNMGLEKSAIATMAVLNHIIEEATQDKFASDESNLDENDVRGMDLLLGLEDNEALEGFEDEELDDPHSSQALEQILTQSPELTNDLSSGLKNKFKDDDVDRQLQDRIKSRLKNIIDTKGDDSDIDELVADKLRNVRLNDNPLVNVAPVNEYMKQQQNKEFGGNATIPVPKDEWGGDNVALDEFNADDKKIEDDKIKKAIDDKLKKDYRSNPENKNLDITDPEVVKAYRELDAWVKSAETKTVDGDELESMLETFIEG